jgi:hypothetical protein
MEKPGKFDEAIRQKVSLLEDEPSAAVWAGIRSEIGPAVPGSTGSWAYRILVAASITFLVALAVVFASKNEDAAPPMANQEEVLPNSQQPSPKTNPQQLANEQRNFGQPREVEAQPWYGPAYPETAAGSLAQEELEESLNEELPVPQNLEGPEQLVERNPEISPEEKAPAPRMEPSPEMDKTTIADNSSSTNQTKDKKRSWRLPRADDLSMDNLKEKSRGILGSIANGAREVLGIDTEFDEIEKEDTRTTAFSANLGFFKVKRKKTVKTK